MRTSSRGRAAIEAREGLRLTAYRDSVGVLTIGFGHTSAAGDPRVTPGLAVTREEAGAILARDLGAYEDAVSRGLGRPAGQGEFDAMVSLCYNIGPAHFARSTVLRRFNRGDRAGAADAFLAWNKAGGRVLAGLTRRREAERAQFLAPPLPPDDAPAPPPPRALPAVPDATAPVAARRPGLLDAFRRITGRR